VNWRLLGEAWVTLAVIMDPLGAVPVFLAVTADLERREKRRAALLAVATAFLVIVLFALGGQQILRYLQVSVPALQASGGLLLLLVALELLTGRSEQLQAATPDQRTSIAMVPLGTPILAGPGAIVATIVLFRRAHGVDDSAALFLAVFLTHVVLWLALRFSGVIARVIRRTGILLVTRVAGMLLAAIAVQMIADGITAIVRAA
jgi:multiple antibiotic resistance protein